MNDQNKSNSSLLFPKGVRKKKCKRHGQSILYQPSGTCYLCIRLHGDCRQQFTHRHHIFGGPNRSISEAEGFTVDLCLPHHKTGEEAVHQNNRIMRIVQQDAQREYERSHTREEFVSLIGRNFL